jgi:predicted alpha/beta hydrolase
MMTEIKILTRDLYKLSARHFIPSEANGHVIIINPATGVKQTFYAHFAAFLAIEGFHVYTYDYRGIGASREGSLKGSNASFLIWGEDDFGAMIKYIKQRHPLLSLSVVGHSLGGQIIGLSNQSELVERFVMIGSQTPFWRHYRGIMLPKIWNLWHVMIPLLTPLLGYFPARSLGLFEDLPAHAAYQWARWGKSKNYLFDELPEKKRIFLSLNQPTLVYSFSDDPYAPLKAVEDLLGHYSNLKVDHRHVEPREVNLNTIGHFSFFRKSSEEIFWKKISEWLLADRNKKKSTVPQAVKATV